MKEEQFWQELGTMINHNYEHCICAIYNDDDYVPKCGHREPSTCGDSLWSLHLYIKQKEIKEELERLNKVLGKLDECDL